MGGKLKDLQDPLSHLCVRVIWELYSLANSPRNIWFRTIFLSNGFLQLLWINNLKSSSPIQFLGFNSIVFKFYTRSVVDSCFYTLSISIHIHYPLLLQNIPHILEQCLIIHFKLLFNPIPICSHLYRADSLSSPQEETWYIIKLNT